MPFLSAGAERYALRVGDNTVGGGSADAVGLPRLARMAPTARITVQPDGSATIQHLGGRTIVRVDKHRIGPEAHPLHHHARISVGKRRLLYEVTIATERGVRTSEPSAAAVGAATVVRPAARPSGSSAQLVDVASGATFPLSRTRTTVGRDASCDIVVIAPGVSRRHASIVARGGGFVLHDESVNGTAVNDERIVTAHPLKHGDVIRLDTEVLRFELIEDAAGQSAPGSDIPPVRAAQATMLFPVKGEEAHEPSPHAAGSAPLASLEVRSGRGAGRVHHITRAVNTIGRDESSDVHLSEPSVSTSHATLLRKGDAWYVVDLGSSNGTYVDGHRIAGERGLSDGCVVRIGKVEMVFRRVPRPAERGQGTRHLVGLMERFQKLW